jgi:hypothetical protein
VKSDLRVIVRVVVSNLRLILQYENRRRIIPLNIVLGGRKHLATPIDRSWVNRPRPRDYFPREGGVGGGTPN